MDVITDIRDLSHDMINWEWSWSHVGKTALDTIGLIPVIGSVKNADEAASIVNGVAKHGDEALDSGGKIVKHGDQLVEGSGKTNISPKMESKILEGQRKAPTKNELIGGHSPDINNANPRYAVEEISVNPDGTKIIKFTTQYPDDNLSNIKKSTIFPDTWSNDSIINGIKTVGDMAVIGIRTSDHRSIVSGVEIEVIKIGNDVISGYPTGGGVTGILSGFSAPTP